MSAKALPGDIIGNVDEENESTSLTNSLETPGKEEDLIACTTGKHQGREKHDCEPKHHRKVVTKTVYYGSTQGVDENLDDVKYQFI